MIPHSGENTCVIFFLVLFFKKKKISQIKISTENTPLLGCRTWGASPLLGRPPLTAQNSLQKGSPGSPAMQKHGTWEGIHLPALLPYHMEEWLQWPWCWGCTDGQVEAG